MSQHLQIRRLGRALRAACSAVLVILSASAAGAQTITLSGTTSTLPFREYATRELGDPWDMSQRTDLGWFTWGTDQPSPNLTSMGMATDGRGNTYFTSRVTTGAGANDPNFWLLDTWNTGAAKLGKLGINYPIDTTVYNVLYLKVKFQGQQLRAAGAPVIQAFWSRDTIYYSATRPNGGFHQALSTYVWGEDVSNIFLTRSDAGPKGSVEGGNWFIIRVPLSTAEIRAIDPSFNRWQNVNPGGTSANWGDPGVLADSLRVDPFHLPIGATLGEMQIDWARLVQYQSVPAAATTVTWTGGGTYDVVVSTQPDCSDFAVVAYSQASGYQLQSQFLPPGTYNVGLRLPFTENGHTAPTGGTLSSCSASSFQVQSYPSLWFTSPNVEGSADDFATTFLGNAWDFDAMTDIDYSRNANTPDATFGIVTVPATDPAGNDLGNVRIYRNRSAPGTAQTGGWGDPLIYPLWPTPSAAGARAARGQNNRIDASRYRILTAEMTVERTREYNIGSIGRVMWHVAGDTRPGGAPIEIESGGIILHHLDPATQNGGKIVLETIQADMADRASLTLEPDVVQSASGWSNTCVPSAASTCVPGPTYKPGIDLFRFDFHEFAAETNSGIRRLKLAALERTGSSFRVAWTGTNPSGLGATVTLKAVPITNAAAGNYQPIDRTCTTASALTIVTGLSPVTGTYDWTPGSTAGVTNGGEYYVCAQIFVSGVVDAIDEVMSRWPVIVDTAFTVAKPTFQLDKSTVRLAGVYRAATSPILSSKTPDEVVRVVQAGSGTVNWSISVIDSNGNPANWLRVTPMSGTGPGTFTIGLSDDPTAMPRCTPVDGNVATVTLTSSDLSNSPRHVQVLATIYPGAGVQPAPGCPHPVGVTAAPFGQIDTPVQNATGVQGAIGVTGWVLDDVGVSDVRIYRNCLPFDNQGNCTVINGQNIVFIGTAAFLAGARPDVEDAFPTRPLAYRAGWGYLMLTAMLPDVPGGFAYGGQGPLNIYAIARDVDGRMTMLGRTQADATPTSINMTNATIAKPFGAIDTPDQGQTVSGLLANFGWVLTRDTDNVADASDILMPLDGSTMGVFLDGARIGSVTYNQCRGNVGPGVPAGTFCDDDVANIFGNPTPLAVVATRTANPTRYRNLDAGRAAIGSFAIDTTALTNGLHTIAWGVTDSANRVEGIGSRFFLVSNSGADAAPLLLAPARDLRPAADVVGLPFDGDTVWGRSTFDVRKDWEAVEPGPGGRRDVRIPELGRLELFLGEGTEDGYLVVKDGLRPLPPGSQLRDGHFTWAPGAGYIGDYNLVFLRGGAQLPVTVKIHPASETGGIQAYIDEPAQGVSVRGQFRVAGWAADSLAWAGAGIGAVHVWAHPVASAEGSGRAGAGSPDPAPIRVASPDPVFLGSAEVGGVRPDVGTTVGPQFERSGWSLVTGRLAPGTYDIVAYFWSTRTGRFEDARTVRVTVR